MSESQSRYSIVERLTKQKLDIMSAKSELKERVNTKSQAVDDIMKELENWKQDIPEENNRTERKYSIEIEQAEREVKNFKEVLSDKELVYDEKIKAIDEALNRIEKISESSVTN